jgi:hypothetical protein
VESVQTDCAADARPPAAGAAVDAADTAADPAAAAAKPVAAAKATGHRPAALAGVRQRGRDRVPGASYGSWQSCSDSRPVLHWQRD